MQFFFIIIFSSVLSLLSFSLTSREKGRARCVVGRGRPPRVDLFFFFSLSLSLYRASGCAGPHVPSLPPDKTKLHPPQKERAKARVFGKKGKEKREKRERKREREKKNKRGEEKKRPARVLIERKKARRRRSRPLPSENIKFEDGIGMNASGIARSDQFERKDAFAR